MKQKVVEFVDTDGETTSSYKAFEIVVITAEGLVSEEANTCNALFESGLHKLHVRKPDASAAQVKTLIQSINPHHRSKIIVHEHHELVEEMNLGGYHVKSSGNAPEDAHDKHVSKSFHSFDEIRASDLDLNYGFLSPIFDSLSKPDYSSRFTMESLKIFLTGQLPFPVYALGGIAINNVRNTKSIGFHGAAIIGNIWQQSSVDERLENFHSLKKQV